MNIKQLIILTFIVVFAWLGYGLFWGDDSFISTKTPISGSVNSSTQKQIQSDKEIAVISLSDITVLYSNKGYVPHIITIKKGDIVSFVNNSTDSMWTASAIHPMHRAYPKSDIIKCNTIGAVGMFDACSGIATGDTWTFQFDTVGTWEYHNHLSPAHIGMVIVE